ncbi:hypothetical protein [Streptomyces sp. NPDC001270]|uniref:hypothetical protein n=1 Tax=Streptomyces sp. NPDC001270 TaxID=3364554 RepID=UPI0036CF4014
MNPITFGPLPKSAPGRRPGKHARAAEQLRAHPGEWAHVTTAKNSASSASLAGAIRAGRLAAYAPAGSFEAAARTVKGEPRVYARYVGPQQ